METPAISKYTVSFGWSLALCSVLNALLVMAKEKSKAVADWMQRLTGHHWLTHVAVIFGLFVLFGCIFATISGNRNRNASVKSLANIVVGGVVSGVVLVLGFYLMAG